MGPPVVPISADSEHVYKHDGSADSDVLRFNNDVSPPMPAFAMVSPCFHQDSFTSVASGFASASPALDEARSCDQVHGLARVPPLCTSLSQSSATVSPIQCNEAAWVTERNELSERLEARWRASAKRGTEWGVTVANSREALRQAEESRSKE